MNYTNLSMVEFNLLNHCNRNCYFCPVLTTEQPEQLSLSLFVKVLNELNKIDYTGGISFSGFSEPLMHTKLFELIKLIKLKVPKSSLTICTNGDFLNKEILYKLFDLGLDKLNISKYENYNKYIDEINHPKVEIRDRTKKDFINNRAGAIKTASKLPVNSICYYPFYALYIDYNGDIQFCPHDYNKQLILGNVKKSSIINLWNFGSKINKIRTMLHNGYRKLPPCSNCDVDGTLKGKESYEIWKETYQTNYKS